MNRPIAVEVAHEVGQALMVDGALAVGGVLVALHEAAGVIHQAQDVVVGILQHPEGEHAVMIDKEQLADVLRTPDLLLEFRARVILHLDDGPVIVIIMVRGVPVTRIHDVFRDPPAQMVVAEGADGGAGVQGSVIRAPGAGDGGQAVPASVGVARIDGGRLGMECTSRRAVALRF